MKWPTEEQKFSTVVSQNTFYFYNPKYEEEWEGNVRALSQNVSILKESIERNGLTEDVIARHITDVDNGLDAILTVTGFSKESLQRLVTFIQLSQDPHLAKVVGLDHWPKREIDSEWHLDKIKRLASEHKAVAFGLASIFLRGATVPALRDVLPLFEFRKLGIDKLSFSLESIIDTLARYKSKGSYGAGHGGNPETAIEQLLEALGLTHDTGKFGPPGGPLVPRTMDFVIPNKKQPRVVVESSYVVTTASGMGDKAKTEQVVAAYLNKHYPRSIFVGFIDGIGWLARRGDLRRMVQAYHDVFTFSAPELKRFEKLLSEYAA